MGTWAPHENDFSLIIALDSVSEEKRRQYAEAIELYEQLNMGEMSRFERMMIVSNMMPESFEVFFSVNQLKGFIETNTEELPLL
jgi:hypothetical protein